MTAIDSQRRRRLLWAAGGAAAAAGLGTALWHASPGLAEAPGAAGGTGIPPELWSLRFQQPDGSDLAMSRFRGRPLLINFWATWCPPCIREMPDVDRFARQFAPNGWQVLGLAVDREKPVREFLGRNPVSYPIALAGFDGISLSRALGNPSGGLPFTVALNAAGAVVHRHIGESTYELLAAWAASPSAQPATPP